MHEAAEMEPERETASAAGDEPDGEPNLPLLDLPAAIVGELLALAQPIGLALMRRANKACHDVHVPLAERIIRQRLKDGFAARGQCRVSAGESHMVCVRPGYGAPYSWGHCSPASWGQPLVTSTSLHHLGQGQEGGPAVRVPRPMVGLGGVAVREVAAGENHTLLLGVCGGVWSCGAGGSGELGHGDHTSHATPRRIDALAQVRAVQVAAGGLHSLVLSADGHVYSFGFGDFGRLGHGDEENQPLPLRIAALRHKRICQVSGGAQHSLAVGEEGELYAWGRGGYGRLGLGEGRLGNQLVPARVALPAGVRIRQASGGSGQSLAVATDGALYSFGHGLGGKLGHGDEKHRWVPTLVEALADTPVRSAAAGDQHSVALTEAGAVLTFGMSGQGRLGHGDKKGRLVPTAVAALAGKEVKKVVEVAAGDRYTVVQLADGELRACGDNRKGQLGTGAAEEFHRLPTKVALPQPPKCAAGSNH